MIEQKSLADVLCEHHIELTVEQIERLDQYCRLLWQWNQKINLTRHTDFDLFVTRDMVDTLQLAKHLNQSEEVLDVGSGGGVPGIVLSILRPDLQISLSESVGKKASVLSSLAETLELPVAVHAARAEQLLEDLRYDALVARAAGPLWKMLKWFEPHWLSIGRLLTVKGPRWVEERGEARHRGLLAHLQLRRVASYPMPGTESESVILKVWPRNTPEPPPLSTPESND